MGDQGTQVSFEEHIKPLFREIDRQRMEWAFDLWSLDDVKENSEAILERLEAGDMPCDEEWPEEQIGMFLVIFLALAAATALDLVFAPWLSRLIVAGAFFLMAAGAALFGLRRMKKPSLSPEETKRTVKEDVEWSKAQR